MDFKSFINLQRYFSTGALNIKALPYKGELKKMKSPSKDLLDQKSHITQSFSTLNQEDEFKNLLERIRKVLLSIDKGLEIEIDKELKIPIYKIIDLTTKEVIKQIPLEDLLKFKKALAKFLQEALKEKGEILGLILSKEV